jgi:hypothetical protein
MGGRFLTDLADVCKSAGLAVVEQPGWQTRARGSGGFDTGRPTHVMVHHTASPRSWDGKRDADYITYDDSDAPLANLYLDRSGMVWVLAAGATNTNGKGHDYWGGGVPDNSMNSYAIGIEAGNEGTGEQWPNAQQDAYLRLSNALCLRYAISVEHVRGHFEWAPDRKIDPAGNSRYASGGASWDMNRFRADCAKHNGQEVGDDVEKYCVRDVDGWPWVTDFASYATGITEDQAARGRDMRGYLVDASGGPFQLDELDSDLMQRLSKVN